MTDPDALEQWLCTTTQKSVQVVVTENRSLLLSLKHAAEGRIVVRAHRMFLDAPAGVHEALAGWILGRRGARRTIREFIRRQPASSQPELPLFTRPRRVFLRVRGKTFDLEELRDVVNRRYFDGKLTCRITWGRRLRYRARRHFTFGTYSHTQNVVRIHPRLDSADVPRYFVEFIVYHEMLHAARGQEGERNGRRIVHSKEFREDERKFERYREAIEWEKKNLPKFLGAA